MLDVRMYTFLELCNTMNYHKTAEKLNMTQPAVTQHIKYLEEEYGCKLFNYSNRKLTKTKGCMEFEEYARTIVSHNLSIKEKLLDSKKIEVRIGATKTVGEYVLTPKIPYLIDNPLVELNLIIDNTENLIESLNNFHLDILILEGHIDKSKYQYSHISKEEIVGICAPTHPFANQEVDFKEIFNHNVVFRESGSGTRAVFEHFLLKKGFTGQSFKNRTILSSNKLIEYSIMNAECISFTYDVIAKSNAHIAQFKIAGEEIVHEFNYVYLDELKAMEIIKLIKA